MVENPSLYIEKDKKNIEKNVDNKDILAKLIKNIVISKKLSISSPKYFNSEKRLIYNKKLNKTAKLYLDLKVKSNNV